MEKLPNYIRAQRKANGLSQQELADLLGGDRGQVSQYEHFNRVPTLATALKLEALFGQPVSKIFAGMYDDAIGELERNADALDHAGPRDITND